MTRTRIGLVMVLLIASGWFVWPRSDVALQQPEAAYAPGSAQSPSPSTSAPAVPSETATTSSDARTEVAVDAAMDEPPIPADATWLTVTVVDGATNQPVAGAEVLWLSSWPWQRIERSFAASERLRSDDEGYFREFGWSARTAANGEARIHLGGDSTQVLARAGSRFGKTLLQREPLPSADERRIVLVADSTVRARVLDGKGEPAAAVPVDVVQFHPSVKLAPFLGAAIHTGGDGIATFRHVQERLHIAAGERRGEPVPFFHVRVAIPGIDVEPVQIDARALPTEPVLLRLPPTGRLQARVDFDGRPLPGATSLGFHAGPKGANAANHAWTTALDADGWARFEFVPLGKTLYLHPTSVGRLRASLGLAGPTGAEQLVVATFDLATMAAAIGGRVLSVEGAPCAGQTVLAEWDSDLSSTRRLIALDRDGRFFAVLGLPHQGRTPRLRKMTIRPIGADAAAQVTVEPRALEVGRNELGDLRLAVQPLVVAGRFEPDTPGPVHAGPRIERLLESADARPVARWQRVDDLAVSAPRTNTFDVHGIVPPGRYRVCVETELVPVDPVEFTLGQRDLVIPIRRGTPCSPPPPACATASWQSRRYQTTTTAAVITKGANANARRLRIRHTPTLPPTLLAG